MCHVTLGFRVVDVDFFGKISMMKSTVDTKVVDFKVESSSTAGKKPVKVRLCRDGEKECRDNLDQELG